MTVGQIKRYYQKGIEDVVNSLKKYDPEKIILFGSAVEGKFHADSDIDVLVIKDTQEPYWKRQIKVTLLYRGWIPTDIFVMTTLEFDRAQKENRFFITEEILKKGKVIYEKSH